MDVLYYSREMKRYVTPRCKVSSLCQIEADTDYSSPTSPDIDDRNTLIIADRKKDANTSSTPNSNRTSRNSIISSPWKSRRRSTRSDGANDRTLPISYFRRTVCLERFIFMSLCSKSRPSDKTIKLWKVFEKSLRVVSESNHHDGQRPLPPPTMRGHLRLPRMALQDNIIAAVPRKVYANAHAYHIHSISVNSDQETYISADDLRINLWNLNISDQSFSKFRSLPHF